MNRPYRRFFSLFMPKRLIKLLLFCILFEVCGCSSAVRARPCQGRGPGLESLYPHHINNRHLVGFLF